MPHKTQVKEIMVPLTNYPHMPFWFSLRQAITLLKLAEADKESYGRPPRVVLVFDEKYQLTGLLRKRDILRGLEPRYLGQGPEAAGSPQMSVEERCSPWGDVNAVREAAGKAVQEFMVPVRSTLAVDDTITRAACVLLKDDVPVLAVMEGTRVAGIAAIEDVFDAITEAVLAT